MIYRKKNVIQCNNSLYIKKSCQADVEQESLDHAKIHYLGITMQPPKTNLL